MALIGTIGGSSRNMVRVLRSGLTFGLSCARAPGFTGSSEAVNPLLARSTNPAAHHLADLESVHGRGRFSDHGCDQTPISSTATSTQHISAASVKLVGAHGIHIFMATGGQGFAGSNPVIPTMPKALIRTTNQGLVPYVPAE